MDAEIKKGNLNEKYDVIILPEDSTAMITGERTAGGRRRRPPDGGYPPEYRSGIGNEGVEALKAFVQKGGTLVTLGRRRDVRHREARPAGAQRAGGQDHRRSSGARARRSR